MLKRKGLISIGLAFIFAVSMTVSVSAALPTAALTLGTATSGLVEVPDGIARDDFSFDYKDGDAGANIVTDITSYSGMDTYPRSRYKDKNENPMGSDVFGEQGLDGSSAFVFAKDADGNQVLQITNTATGTIRNRTRYFKFVSGQNIRLSYDVCFPSIPADMTSTNFLSFMGNWNGGIWATTYDGEVCLYAKEGASSAADADSFKPVAGKWYTIIGEISTNPDDNKGYLTTYMIDKETQEIKIKSVGADAQYPARNYLQGAEFSGTNSADKKKMKVWLDNAELVFYNPSQYLPEMTATTAQGEELARNTKLTFSFDLPVKLGTATLKKGGEIVSGPSASLGGIGDTVILSYTGLLDRNAEYTVSFEGFTSSDDTPITISDVTFKTEDLHSWNDVEIGNVSANSGDSSKTDITFTLSEEYSYTVFSGGVLAALYRDGQMKGIDMLTLNNQNITSAVTKSFTLGVSPVTGDKVILMQVDTEGNILPLASGEFTVE